MLALVASQSPRLPQPLPLPPQGGTCSPWSSVATGLLTSSPFPSQPPSPDGEGQNSNSFFLVFLALAAPLNSAVAGLGGDELLPGCPQTSAHRQPLPKGSGGRPRRALREAIQHREGSQHPPVLRGGGLDPLQGSLACLQCCYHESIWAAQGKAFIRREAWAPCGSTQPRATLLCPLTWHGPWLPRACRALLSCLWPDGSVLTKTAQVSHTLAKQT